MILKDGHSGRLGKRRIAGRLSAASQSVFTPDFGLPCQLETRLRIADTIPARQHANSRRHVSTVRSGTFAVVYGCTADTAHATLRFSCAVAARDDCDNVKHRVGGAGYAVKPAHESGVRNEQCELFGESRHRSEDMGAAGRGSGRHVLSAADAGEC